MLSTICPVCRHDLRAPDRYGGKMWRCPDCRTAFVVPAAGGPAAPIADEPPAAPFPWWSVAYAAAVVALAATVVAAVLLLAGRS